MTLLSAFRCFSSLAILASAVSITTNAAGLRSEAEATAAGLLLVETAADGRVDEAFKAAAALGGDRDQAIAGTLQLQRSTLASVSTGMGAQAGRVRLQSPEATIFSGCINREYRAIYAGGEQRWRLKFRRLHDGWVLADLAVISEPAG